MRRLYILPFCMILALGAGAVTVPHIVHAADVSITVTGFTPTEKRVIKEWYTTHTVMHETEELEDGHGSHKHKGGKHGKVGNKGLPPGIAKNLARGKPLPPGIAKRYLPSGLIRQLPPVPVGYERIVIDRDIVLVNKKTQAVVDIIRGIATLAN